MLQLVITSEAKGFEIERQRESKIKKEEGNRLETRKKLSEV